MLGSDYSPSLGLLGCMLDGAVPASVKFASGYADVRDVADPHLRAMTDPAPVGERFIAQSGPSLWVRDIAPRPIGQAVVETTESLLALASARCLTT